jgi:hypothetical protein
VNFILTVDQGGFAGRGGAGDDLPPGGLHAAGSHRLHEVYVEGPLEGLTGTRPAGEYF